MSVVPKDSINFDRATHAFSASLGSSDLQAPESAFVGFTMLLGEYDCSLRNIVAIIDPQSAAAVPQLLLKPQVSEQIRLQHLLVCFKRCFATVTVVLLGVLVAWTATLDTRYAQRLSNPLVWMPAMTLLVALLIELIVTDIRQNFDLHPSVQTLTRSDGMFCRRCSMHGMKARTT